MDRERTLFIDMLREIGSAATSPSSLSLLQMQHAGRFFITPITTSTSQQDANISSVSTYCVFPVLVSVLSLDNMKKLAKEFLRLRNVAPNDIVNVLKLPAF
eukprot:scaffold1274_cov60-Attheya_sp.AAC.6